MLLFPAQYPILESPSRSSWFSAAAQINLFWTRNSRSPSIASYCRTQQTVTFCLGVICQIQTGLLFDLFFVVAAPRPFRVERLASIFINRSQTLAGFLCCWIQCYGRQHQVLLFLTSQMHGLHTGYWDRGVLFFLALFSPLRYRFGHLRIEWKRWNARRWKIHYIYFLMRKAGFPWCPWIHATDTHTQLRVEGEVVILHQNY